MLPTYYRGCWHVVSRSLFMRYLPFYSLIKGVYDPRAFVLHAVLLRQGCPHCAIFLAAATRRYMVRVSVPLWGITLSRPLPVLALVSFYLTNKLMGRRLLLKRRSFPLARYRVLAIVSNGCPLLQGRYQRVTHPFATFHIPNQPKCQ